jgi:hypothetical protein
MSGRIVSLTVALAAAIGMSLPDVTLARGGGGGGGGHGGGGGGHGGGGHSGGGHSSGGHSIGGSHSHSGGYGHPSSGSWHSSSGGVAHSTHTVSSGSTGTVHHGSFVGNHVVPGNHFAHNQSHQPGWHAHHHHHHGFPFFGYGFGGGGWWYPWLIGGTGNYGYGYFDPAQYATLDPSMVPPQEGGLSDSDLTPNALKFAEAGERAFWSGDYNGAVYAWRHAVLDAPDNPVLVMMLGQALFATGQFDEAAGATQAAMQMLPKEQWGVVIVNFRELYGNVPDYTTQLRALEKAVAEKPDNPARRFLAGFQYAYLGYPKFAIDQLDKGLKAEPRDEMAKQLRDEMQSKLPKETAPATPPAPPPSS